ncbi:hypothetical protein CJF30_00001122 [Rutstroemia sp. NJR-2017a BBW]|nr:hypothetical protein CJF30_00001122 [Rutstroemia sp. NJR-2017a BBW]
MHLPTTLLLSLLSPLLIHAIALPQPDIVKRQDPALPSADPELDIDIPDDGVPRAPGGPVIGKFTKPRNTAQMA